MKNNSYVSFAETLLMWCMYICRVFTEIINIWVLGMYQNILAEPTFDATKSLCNLFSDLQNSYSFVGRSYLVVLF